MRHRRFSVGLALAITWLLAGVATASASAATVVDQWTASIGSGAALGTATMRAFSTGTGSVYVNLKHLVGSATYGETINAGTCSSVGVLIATLPALRTSSTGTVARTSTLGTSGTALARKASSAVLRLTYGSHVYCGWFTYGLKLPFTKESGTWWVFNGYHSGVDHVASTGTLYALDFNRTDGQTAGSGVVSPASGTVIAPSGYPCFGYDGGQKFVVGWGLTIELDRSSTPDGHQAYLQLCHIDGTAPAAGTHLAQGQFLGTVTDDHRPTFDNTHIHLALFLAKPSDTDHTRVSVPFAGYWRLEAGYDLSGTSETTCAGSASCATYVSSQPMPPSGIKGQVLDLNGQPAAASLIIEAALAGTSDYVGVDSDSQGRFTLQLPPGDYVVNVWGRGSVWPSGYSGVGGALVEPTSQAVAVTVVAGSLTPLTLRYPAIRHISGTVVATGTTPLSELYVFAFSLDGVTDGFIDLGADGSFTIAVLPGTYILVVDRNHTVPALWYAEGPTVTVGTSDVTGVSFVVP